MLAHAAQRPPSQHDALTQPPGRGSLSESGHCELLLRDQCCRPWRQTKRVKWLRQKSSSSTARGSESGLRYHAKGTMLLSKSSACTRASKQTNICRKHRTLQPRYDWNISSTRQRPFRGKTAMSRYRDAANSDAAFVLLTWYDYYILTALPHYYTLHSPTDPAIQRSRGQA